MLDQVIGCEVVSFEVFEPWCAAGSLDPTGEPAFGGIALELTGGATVLIESNARYGHRGESKSALHTSVYDEGTWGLRRSQLSGRIRLLGRRGCVSYRQSRSGSFGSKCCPFPPIPMGVPLTLMWADTAAWGGEERVSLQFSGHRSPVDFVAAPAFDSGVKWKCSCAQDAVPIDMHSGGEFGWMHPSAKLPVRYGAHLVNSCDYQDWPLALRRAVFSTCWSDALAQMRQTRELAAIPELWASYEMAAIGILVQRWRQ